MIYVCMYVCMGVRSVMGVLIDWVDKELPRQHAAAYIHAWKLI